MSLRCMIAALALAASACAASSTANSGNATTTPPTAPPETIAILDGSQAREILEQCSRDTPEAGEGSWQPNAAEIAALEQGLAAALRQQQPRVNWSQFPNGWRRQYVGIVRGGRRTIYGNFVPSSIFDPPRYPGQEDRWRVEPVIICDGGPRFFGVEYDPETKRYIHFGFNGSA